MIAGAVRRITNDLRMLPDFVILGTQRGGTSSLYHYLEQHPCIGGAFRKEIHFFDLRFDRGEGWYRAHFPMKLRRSLHSIARDRIYLTGEACPYYLFHPLVPERLARLLPEARLIALLRNPADRAISHYHHERKKGREPLSLAEAIRCEEERLRPELDALERRGTFGGEAHRRFSYLARGRYAEQLERWLRWFPPERLLVIASEEFFSAPAAAYRAVLRFLDLPAWEPPAYLHFNRGSYSGVDARLHAELGDYFRPHNERLYELLGRDLGWGDPAGGEGKRQWAS
ncbi:MAG: sulfotransferase domain-containing protein [Candidatus Binatia bacterium]